MEASSKQSPRQAAMQSITTPPRVPSLSHSAGSGSAFKDKAKRCWKFPPSGRRAQPRVAEARRLGQASRQSARSWMCVKVRHADCDLTATATMLSSAAVSVVSSSTCSPPAAPMRPPPPPPPPKHQHAGAAKGPEPRPNHEEPSSSIPDLGESLSPATTTILRYKCHAAMTLRRQNAALLLRWRFPSLPFNLRYSNTDSFY